MAYRGYSESEGIPSEPGLKLDGIAILEYIFSRGDIDTSKIFVLGRSLGGAVATYAVNNIKHEIAGLILENTFTSIDDLVDVIFSYLSILKPFVLRNHWQTQKLIQDINCPILFIKALKDELIPPRMMNELYIKAVNSKYRSVVIFNLNKFSMRYQRLDIMDLGWQKWKLILRNLIHF